MPLYSTLISNAPALLILLAGSALIAALSGLWRNPGRALRSDFWHPVWTGSLFPTWLATLSGLIVLFLLFPLITLSPRAWPTGLWVGGLLLVVVAISTAHAQKKE